MHPAVKTASQISETRKSNVSRFMDSAKAAGGRAARLLANLHRCDAVGEL
jgi:hypothetical protein